MMYRIIFAIYVCILQLVCVSSEGISHSSHLMLVAAEKGDTKTVVDYITVTGVPINVKNNYGVSAILFAANNGHLDLLKALVGIGANIEDRSNNWKTPLNWAATWGHFSCVKYLVGAGANISAYDAKGVTPLMAATQKEDVEIVQFLLDQGADPTTKNIFNGTALSIAQIKNNTLLISILEPYYPEEEETSPYVIAYQLLKTELIKLSKVTMQESARIWHYARFYLALVRAEVELRWAHYQQQSAASVGKGEVTSRGDGSCADDTCLPASKQEHESDEF